MNVQSLSAEATDKSRYVQGENVATLGVFGDV